MSLTSMFLFLYYLRNKISYFLFHEVRVYKYCGGQLKLIFVHNEMLSDLGSEDVQLTDETRHH